MGRECLGHFLEEVLCCLKVGLKVLWEPGGGWPHPGLELQRPSSTLVSMVLPPATHFS